jgi:DTW domain-containing protein YfiP
VSSLSGLASTLGVDTAEHNRAVRFKTARGTSLKYCLRVTFRSSQRLCGSVHQTDARNRVRPLGNEVGEVRIKKFHLYLK